MFRLFRLTYSFKLSRDFKTLCLYQTIVALANGMMGLFLPIFLFQQFNSSIYWVIIFYLIGHFLYALLVPFGAMIMNKIGIRKAMLIGRSLCIPFYIFLYFFHNDPLLFAILANVVLLFFRLFYWVPYHVDFVRFTDGKHRGRQMSYLAVLGYLVSIGGPLLAGILLTQFSFGLLFVLVALINILALIPLSKLSEPKAKFEFSYKQTFKELFKRDNCRSNLACFGDGAQTMVGVMIWPIFIYQILEHEYMAVGAVTALIVIGTIFFQLIIGKYTDEYPKRKLMHIGSSFYALGWLAKAFVATAFQVFVVGAFHSLMAILLRTPFDALHYEQIGNTGSYVDEYTVLREMSINMGWVLMGLLLIVLIGLVGLQIAFLIAAAFSLLVNLL